MKIDFVHTQSAHCECGVTANLINHEFKNTGQTISEAMTFGLGQGIFFGYLPFIKVNKLPLTTFRCPVGNIFKGVTKSLGVSVKWQKFSNATKAMDALDRELEKGNPVGCRTGGYWLPYFPPSLRFHFNMHNIVVIGKQGNNYLISDPVFPALVECPAKDLAIARFAKGALAPKGSMYKITKVPDHLQLEPAVINSIKGAAKAMVKTPIPFLGTRGIRFLANRLENWPKKFDHTTTILLLGQLIRMQEEIGTGGGGFRFMYSAFLQEAAPILGDKRLLGVSEQLTASGDTWRRFAVKAAKNCKGRAKAEDSFQAMKETLNTCADIETQAFKELIDIVR
jgi:hypothetical protein